MMMIVVFVLSGAPAAAQTPGGKESRVVLDHGNRKLQVEKPFERIISLYGAHTENLFSLGLEKEIIGVSRHEVFPPGALKKPVFSYHDDPEKFLGARPDLVLIRPMIDRGYPQFVSRLERSGIAVASMQPSTVEEMYQYWGSLGALTGKQKAANEMIDRFKEAVSDFKSLTAGTVVRKKVYFEAIHSKMKTFSPNSMAIFALETAGGINVAADAKPSRGTNVAIYGKERILEKANDIDVFLSQYGAMNHPTIAMILEEPGFKAIKAIQNGQVYLVDEMTVSRPTVRMLRGIYEIGKILYPDLFGKEALAILDKACLENRSER